MGGFWEGIWEACWGAFGGLLDSFWGVSGALKAFWRLNVPLLGEIPISQELMEACDEGTPIVVKDRQSRISHVFSFIVDKIEDAVA